MNIILSCIKAFHSLPSTMLSQNQGNLLFIYVIVNSVTHDTRHIKFNTYYIHLAKY